MPKHISSEAQDLIFRLLQKVCVCVCVCVYCMHMGAHVLEISSVGSQA